MRQAIKLTNLSESRYYWMVHTHHPMKGVFIMADETVLLGHGSGGTMMKCIIDDVFAAH